MIEQCVIDPKDVEEQLRLRATRVRWIATVLDATEISGFSNEEAFGMLACYLSDQLEAATAKLLQYMNSTVPPMIYGSCGRPECDAVLEKFKSTAASNGKD